MPPDNLLDIKSPVFKARPGWGGQLKLWINRELKKPALPLAALVLLAIGIWIAIFG